MIKRRRDFLFGSSLVYAATLALVGLVQETIAERLWLGTLLTYAPQIIAFVPLPFLLLPAIVKRRRNALIALAVAAVLCVCLLRPVWRLPRPTPAPKPGDLVVVSYNIAHGNNMAGIADALAGQNPDIVVLSEVSGFGRFPDPLPALRRSLPGWNIERAGEVAIASRLPLNHVIPIRFSSPGQSVQSARDGQIAPARDGLTKGEAPTVPRSGDAYFSGRVALRVSARTPGGDITVIAAHLSTGFTGETATKNRSGLPTYLKRTARARKVQTDDLLREIGRIGGPVLLCGDFNTPPVGEIYRALTAALTDSFAAAGSGLGHTYSSNRPLVRIDYIFAKNLSVADARVLNWPHSDHNALRATVRLEPAR